MSLSILLSSLEVDLLLTLFFSSWPTTILSLRTLGDISNGEGGSLLNLLESNSFARSIYNSGPGWWLSEGSFESVFVRRIDFMMSFMWGVELSAELGRLEGFWSLSNQSCSEILCLSIAASRLEVLFETSILISSRFVILIGSGDDSMTG